VPAATIVLSTLPVLADRLGAGEGWHHFPKQRSRLLRLLAASVGLRQCWLCFVVHFVL
jgi:hypothetical protein